jgi:hypothetical protein
METPNDDTAVCRLWVLLHEITMRAGVRVLHERVEVTMPGARSQGRAILVSLRLGGARQGQRGVSQAGSGDRRRLLFYVVQHGSRRTDCEDE